MSLDDKTHAGYTNYKLTADLFCYEVSQAYVRFVVNENIHDITHSEQTENKLTADFVPK